MSKEKFTDEEMQNDPSLRWCGYRYGEVLYSDAHASLVRFDHYCEKRVWVYVLEVNSMAPLQKPATVLQVRRPSVMENARKPLSEQEKEGLTTQQKMYRALRNKPKEN